MNAALLFEPDGYLLTGPRLMGRQSAGHGFLRAAVRARGDGPVTAYTPFAESAEVFRRTVAEIDPGAATHWIPGQRLDLLAQAGLLYRPDPVLGRAARQRLRVGPAAYCLCGVTHTLAGAPLDGLAKLLVEPVMPWDAVVCTSSSALSVVTAVLDAQEDYLRWRDAGAVVSRERPLLPVIPLGVHCDDFVFADGDRAAARDALGLGVETIAVLFAGRLSVNGKAHPYAMLSALQAVAAESGKPLVLVLAGQPANPAGAEALNAALKAWCPGVPAVFVDGKDAHAYRLAWAAADLFVSLADSIQETFGLTPVEAMAAGLPALISDWNGYRDTVRDGIDGFRIATWAPEPSGGQVIAHDFEIGLDGVGEHLGRSNGAVSVDAAQLAARLRDLVTDAALRRRMGEAGRARARSVFDWAVVFKAYQALWTEQTALREAARADRATQAWLARAPRSGPDHMGPFATFASYPTHHVTDATQVALAPGMTAPVYRARIAEPSLSRWTVVADLADRIFAALGGGPMRVTALAAALALSPAKTREAVARLAKLDALRLSSGD